jgi:hypothetical protein
MGAGNVMTVQVAVCLQNFHHACIHVAQLNLIVSVYKLVVFSNKQFSDVYISLSPAHPHINAPLFMQ